MLLVAGYFAERAAERVQNGEQAACNFGQIFICQLLQPLYFYELLYVLELGITGNDGGFFPDGCCHGETVRVGERVAGLDSRCFDYLIE